MRSRPLPRRADREPVPPEPPPFVWLLPGDTRTGHRLPAPPWATADLPVVPPIPERRAQERHGSLGLRLDPERLRALQHDTERVHELLAGVFRPGDVPPADARRLEPGDDPHSFPPAVEAKRAA